ncbi:hypothetical protein A3D05_05625 [Candidatus Gottesmanbacteria bacterium RIFCSPHIGHO2_02_FULL_40_24]|uniref:DUF5666 domain-containing protein n=1 Tax=Candidatus Gottesmanbacteria bacterium RIFCSPHIGHO2_01_FULL_40_15 TaxID=1798376 RepID=A0A1F5Z7N3_9BACT|nr:MAG: hypothetical protein A2777_02260 [Candidatus Gottesmanbacteria bacterium RIFCSPHIGHO2_01_FULL_40_15]OGG16509.1 MAG: hypothetical protein A3D05_05625 [Candidatus Gottesmanbacteria bacterium RIFCSPHIGHO2_02_FULL_40_24]OGG22587.1 MAG: hypothetical protein A3B48_02100 [Candidatus Gottesmanbacteria bacterium RIFCSPLOWO2_01_FULL_40_10]OGG25622.1 MAG: hypothetical protein A3E42_04775 [Candidatus Gottesmanbacteria bacterium RIFCSPHIGHO2_12_FULL_40_13]OGG32625.1 MAG: hypothetical protein A3I80_0
MKPVYVIIIAIIALSAGFFGGMKYNQSKVTANRMNIFRQFDQEINGQNNIRRQVNNRPVAGEIINIDGNSFTVKMSDEQSKIVLLKDTTQINQATKVSITDLKQGSQVVVFGSENSDGSVTAQNIQLNPQYGRYQTSTPTPSPGS